MIFLALRKIKTFARLILVPLRKFYYENSIAELN